MENKMKLEKEVYIKNFKCIHDKDTDGVFSTLDIIFCDLLTEKEVLILKKFLNKAIKTNKAKLTLEYQEPILDEAERKYLSGVIRPFRDSVEYIKKIKDNYRKEEYIVIHTNQIVIPFPFFKKGTMYKGMELNKEYTAEELGL